MTVNHSGSEQRLLMLIEEELSQARLVSSLVSKVGWRAICIPDAQVALTTLVGPEGQRFSAVILDHWTVGQDGPRAITQLRERCPDLPVVMLTCSMDISHAVEAMRAGATDYLVKPFSADRLLGALRLATGGPSTGELQPLSEKLDLPVDFESMVGADPAFRAAQAHAALAARGHGHVLAEGEGGTGKTMLLRAIHAASPRSKKPFKVVNVRSLSETALRSALFGHEKGAFPGAFNKQVGALQYCDGGTLLLQEVNRLSSGLQNDLAAFVAEAKVRPVGAEYGFKVDVRMLATSNQPLMEMVDTGRYHSQLYEALAATRIELPPLRLRAGDIPALARYFVNRMRQQGGARQLSINDDAFRLLCSFAWPGNVRQLQSVLLRASAFCAGDALTASDLPALAQLAGKSAGTPFERGLPTEQAGVALFTPEGNLRPLQDIEADVIRLALGHYRGRMSEVARRLGIGRSTLYRKISDLEIESAPDQELEVAKVRSKASAKGNRY